MTCASGAAPVDMMLNLVASQVSAGCAAQASRYLCIDRIRTPNERQICPVSARLGGVRSDLEELVELMEANIEEPFIEYGFGTARRLVEPTYATDVSRACWSFTSRISHEGSAQACLHAFLGSAAEIGAISSKCGLKSACSFSRAQRREFGHTPAVERRHPAIPS
jgi:AraC family transcriptional regulator, glycine betaine-responsive activator